MPGIGCRVTEGRKSNGTNQTLAKKPASPVPPEPKLRGRQAVTLANTFQLTTQTCPWPGTHFKTISFFVSRNGPACIVMK
jgi:hypothetical protein